MIINKPPRGRCYCMVRLTARRENLPAKPSPITDHNETALHAQVWNIMFFCGFALLTELLMREVAKRM